MILHVDNSALVVLTNKLEKIHKSAFPLAVRGTLNKAAFNVKQISMPQSAAKHFQKRKPNFFKANSRVEMANGFDVNSMRSIVGFVSSMADYNHYAVHELEQQEYGGAISHRSFVPLDPSRSGSSYAKPVLPSNRLERIRKIVRASDMVGRSRKQKYIKAALKAGKGGFVIAGLMKETLYRIESITRGAFGETIIKNRALYSFDQGRKVEINETGFMREATMNSAAFLEKFYIEEAKRQFEKYLK